MTSALSTTGVGGRRVQFEMFFTLPDFSDISLRDYQETMQRPFFSLSKKKRVRVCVLPTASLCGALVPLTKVLWRGQCSIFPFEGTLQR